MKHKKANEPQTAFGRFMVYTFIPNYANNVNGIVYFGAAFLIIIVGLRGLGREAGTISAIPKFLLNDVGSINPNWVIAAILLEFFLLTLLATVTFFTPEENHHQEKAVEDEIKVPQRPKVDMERELNDLRDLVEKEVKMVNEYLDKYEAIAEKLNKMQMKSVKAIQEMKDAIKS